MKKKDINELRETINPILEKINGLEYMFVVNDENDEQALSIMKGEESNIASAIYSIIMDKSDPKRAATFFKIVADVVLNVVRSDVSKLNVFMTHLNEIITARMNFVEN